MRKQTYRRVVGSARKKKSRKHVLRAVLRGAGSVLDIAAVGREISSSGDTQGFVSWNDEGTLVAKKVILRGIKRIRPAPMGRAFRMVSKPASEAARILERKIEDEEQS